jgi:hypothetical protein
MKTLPGLITSVLAVIATTLLIFSACKKQDDATSAGAQQEFAAAAAETDATADVVFDDLFDNVMGVNSEVGIGGTGVFGRAGVSSGGNRLEGVDSAACYVVTIKQVSTSSRFPLQVTIDFGGGCTSADGRVRAGKVNIVYTGKMTGAGNSATTTFDGYYIDNIKVEGTQKITNTSTPDKKSYTSVVTNARLTWANGNYSQWNSEKTVTQTDGAATPLIAIDDIFSLTGQANGSIQKDDKYFQWATAITSPLVKRYICHYFSKGTLSLSKGNVVVAVLDYGNGACDKKATFTVNGVVQEITLH